MNAYDVLVVGAGPAGATAARYLARGGLSTLLLDREIFPRHKPCGGALPSAVARYLDFDYSDTVDNVVTSVTLLCHGLPSHTLNRPDARVAMVSRDRFDHRLVQEAVRAGAELQTGTQVAAVREESGRVVVQDRHGRRWQAKMVVGADGARSVVARASGLDGTFKGIALAGELYPGMNGLPQDGRTQAIFALGEVPSGYAWIFPKRDHFSIGVGTASRFPMLAQAYRRLKESWPFLRSATERFRRGWWLPFNQGSRVLNTARVCLAGDAASLVDPLTGEGIYHAIRSGAIAAEVIEQELRAGGRLTQRYTREINRQIVEDLVQAAPLAEAVFRSPAFFYRHEVFLHWLVRLVNKEVNYGQALPQLVALMGGGRNLLARIKA